ncbi:MAG: PSD1 and planctomycete cytochrome C domain-containing protein [Planctomycetaceae bacterium]
MSTRVTQRFPALLVAGILTIAISVGDERDDFFESRIRPILVEQCSACHGAKKQSGGLRVDSHQALLNGGDSGAAVVPGNLAQSLLVKAVRRSEDLAMPPEKSLSQVQVDSLEQWISKGAIWPGDIGQLASRDDRAAQDHWAFQPVQTPAVPPQQDWGRSPVDAFVLRALQANGMHPAPEADRRTLLRRASYVLTGLPPTPDEVAAFVTDSSAEAWQRVVNRLLDSPEYGEHWARHWLDVARYADTKGYVYAREERFWVHAWAYRDWVIKAFNADMPYDRFLLLQLAADQVEDRDAGDIAAMGFLTLGRRFLGIPADIVDDRIDVVTRSTMGLTVSCARCHDHKYDPIPTTDYYALYGIFDSCAVHLTPVDPPTDKIRKRLDELIAVRRQRCDEASERYRDRLSEYLMAQTELHKYPPAGFDQIITAADLHPRIVSQWQTWLYTAERRGDPVFRAWHDYRSLQEETFADHAPEVTQRLAALTDDKLNPLVKAAFATSPGSFSEVVDRYATLLTSIDQEWRGLVASAAQNEQAVPETLPDADREQLRQVLYGPGSPCIVPEEHIANTEMLFPSAVVNELWKHQNEVDRLIIDAAEPVAYAMTLVDRAVPAEPRVFRRGNPAMLGEPVERRFLSLFSEEGPNVFRVGSGRRELADAIVDPANPLTARVIVNRVWMHVFGRGLVRTPSDFGLRAEQPSHPELLDWLASWFMKNDWSLKKLHRLILTSAVFQQASQLSDASLAAEFQRVDPENRLLWHFHPHRLSFEELRDSWLSASGELELTRGGKAFDLFAEGSPGRRTVYGRVDRQFLPGAFRTFDFPSPDLPIDRRSETTVPQQALFTLNHRMVLDRARHLAAQRPEATAVERIQHLFQRVLQRDPSAIELEECQQLIAAASDVPQNVVKPTVADWSYGYGAVDEQQHQVVNFQVAPHFTGTAWQGGPAWPDAKLGWVNLTAVGGHPGNTRQHACARRWTAPRDMTVRIVSKMTHEPAAGDGIRAFVLAGGQTLHAEILHQKSVDLNVETLSVSAGDVVDFVVDIHEQLNSDQFLWKIAITDVDMTVKDHSEWDSEADFTRNTAATLSPWEQLAHLLLCTNEFLFVD